MRSFYMTTGYVFWCLFSFFFSFFPPFFSLLVGWLVLLSRAFSHETVTCVCVCVFAWRCHSLLSPEAANDLLCYGKAKRGFSDGR